MDALLRAVVHKSWDGLDGWCKQPDFCRMVDNRGLTPLHLTVSHGAPLHVVRALLETWRAAAEVLDADGATPLHLVVAKQAKLETIAAVLNAHPPAAALGANVKLLPASGDAAKSRWGDQTAPAATRGFTPLHWALVTRNAAAAALLLSAEGVGKQSAAVACAAGRLPLHTAAANEAEKDLIEQLMDAHPPALQAVDAHGALPLHHAFANGAPFESQAALVAKNPGTAQAKAKNGWTALHYLAASGESGTAEATHLLVNAWTGAVSAKDDNDRTAVHVACASSSPLPVVRALLHRWVGASGYLKILSGRKRGERFFDHR